MRRVLRILVYAGIAVGIGWVFAVIPGRISAEIGDFSIDLPTALAALGVLLLAILTHLLLGLLRLPGRLAAWSAARRRRHGDVAVSRALVALAAADAGDARREARRARKLLGETPQTLLLAAEAGRLAGREDEATEAFRALSGRKDAAFLGLRGLLRQAIAREDWTQAADLARRAEAAHPGAGWLREERARLAIRARDWAGALQLTGAPVPAAALATAAAATEPDPSRALALAKRAWEADPALAPAALAYAMRLRVAGKERRAQAVIRETWAARPHPDLGVFALAPIEEPLARVDAAKRLANANSDHAESHLLIARACLAAKLTGEARRQVELARAAGLTQRRLFLLLAEIEEAEGGQNTAARAALHQAAAADPDPVWRCTVCHTPSTDWHAACSSCMTPGGLRWDGSGNDAAGPVGPAPGRVRRLLPWR
jgi:HemY protein